MASLPFLVVRSTFKLEPEIRKQRLHLSIEKRGQIAGQPGKEFDPIGLESRLAPSVASREGFTVDGSIYVPLLQECMEKASVSAAEIVHGHIVKTGRDEDLFLMTFLVNVYGRCKAMENARKVFEKLPQRNVVTWTSLMMGYVLNSQPEIAIRVFLEMLEVGAYPTNYTLGVVLKACSSPFGVELGKQIHSYIIKYHVEYDTSIGNALCSLYSKCGNLRAAVKSFRRIEEKNVISWTTVISACGDNGDSAMGLNFFSGMLCEGIEPNEFTLTSALSLCCVMLALDVGLQVHSLSIKLGHESNLPVTNSIMYLYLKCGCVREAKKLCDGMETVSLVTWNAMIAGHAQMMDLAEDGLSAYHCGVEALNIFLRLHGSGTKPDLFTFSSTLTVCSSLLALQQGEQIHAQTIKTGFLSEVVVGTALVNMYNKCGSIERASKAFVEMSTRTLISWTSMITGFAQHGRSQQALQLFEDTRFVGIKPNAVTFVGVLSACSHAGMVDEALFYFEMMKTRYKIKPVMDHFACLIDMFVRLGRLDEAFDIIKRMEFEPSEFIWSMLIAGCRSHRNLELGFYAAEELLKLTPRNSETCVLLLNMYLSAERWRDVSRVRKLMREEKIGKLKDWSWIGLKGKVYSFMPNDLSRTQYERADQLLGELLEKARGKGYESQGGLEVTNEASSSGSVHHSEKLAVAFGLLNAPAAMPIRVAKNTSMCQDCHSFMKFISALTARQIIVRDTRRLHKFTGGRCSCGDFGSLL